MSSLNQIKYPKSCLTFFTAPIENPSPDTYRQASTFDQDSLNSSAFYKGKKKSFCFGAGREDFTTMNYKTTGPGPQGSYSDETRNIG